MPDGLGGGLAALAIVLAVSAGAVATDRSTAEAQPATLRAGQDLTLVFEIGDPDLAEIVVGEDVNCTVALPDGSTESPCNGSGALLEVRQGENDSRQYVFAYQAPDQVGSYAVAFEASSTAQLAPHDHSAETTFRVLDADEPAPTRDDPGEDDPAQDPPDEEDPQDPQDPEEVGDGREGAGETEDPRGEDAALASVDGARLTASTTVAVAVLLAGLVGIRT